MKNNIFTFVSGVVVGAFIMLLVGGVVSSNSKEYSDNNGIELFEKEGDCVSENSFKVFQVLDSGDALANEMGQGFEADIPTGLTVLFLKENGRSHYDDQLIRVPSGKCAKQIGTFRYSTKSDIEKTVPVVRISNK
ncbi:hypothetical protein [Prevotella sp.]|uniref:hypothetical protein n=1 Tax=Prevotella sp. TaxID=59823 RepID=UPI002F931378